MVAPVIIYLLLFDMDVSDALRLLQVFCIAAAVIAWIIYHQRAKRAVKVMTDGAEDRLRSAFNDSLGSIDNLRRAVAAKEAASKSGQNALTAERIQQLRGMLDQTERALRQGIAKPDLGARANAMQAAAAALLKTLAEVNLDSAKELEAMVASAQGARPDGGSAAPPEAIKKLEELAASARSAFEESRINTDISAAARSLARGKRALQEGAAIEKALGLRIVNPV